MTTLAQVRKAAEKDAIARLKLIVAIQEAYASGQYSLRELADATGLAHETVRNITRKKV